MIRLNQVKVKMCENLDNLLERGEGIEILVEKSNSMRLGSTHLRGKVIFMNLSIKF